MDFEQKMLFFSALSSFWRIFWRDNWRSIIVAVENFRYLGVGFNRKNLPYRKSKTKKIWWYKCVDSYFQNSWKHVERALVDNIVLQAVHIVSFDDFFTHMNSVGPTARSLGK